jgi:hypothetical protein
MSPAARLNRPAKRNEEACPDQDIFIGFETLVICRDISMQQHLDATADPRRGKLTRPALPTETVMVPWRNIKIKINLNNEI